MTDEEINAQIAHLEGVTAFLRSQLSSRSPTPAPPAARKQPTASPRWELAARAFRRFPLEPHTVRRICGDHPEWAKKFRDGQWFVDADKFDEFAARVEAGQASFAVSTLSAKSVAADEQLAISFDQQSIRENEDVK